jgi:hypothetical protein
MRVACGTLVAGGTCAAARSNQRTRRSRIAASFTENLHKKIIGAW